MGGYYPTLANKNLYQQLGCAGTETQGPAALASGAEDLGMGPGRLPWAGLRLEPWWKQAGGEAPEEGEKAEVAHLPRVVLPMQQWSSLRSDFVPWAANGGVGGDATGISLAEARNPAKYHSWPKTAPCNSDPTQHVSSATLERAHPTTIPKRRPVSSRACRANLLVKLSVHQQSSYCLPQKMSKVGWPKALASKGITDAHLDPS